MLILALDTSGDVCSVSLLDGVRERVTYSFRHERRLTERLPDVVRFVLGDAGARLRDVEALAVGLGPGSFTGVRVGVTVAKVWSLTLARPLIGVSSLDALAEPLAGVVESGVAAVAPTRRTEVVAAFYRPGEVAPVAPPHVLANADVVTAARDALGTGALLVCGEAAEAVRQADPNAPARFAVLSPSAAAVGRLAAARLSRGESDDADALTPLYVTPTPVG